MENSNFNAILQQLYAALIFELFEVNLLAYEFFATKIFQFCRLIGFSASCYYLFTITKCLHGLIFWAKQTIRIKKKQLKTRNKQSYKTLATIRITVLSELQKKTFSPRGSEAVFSSPAVFSSSFCRWILGTSPMPMAARMLSIELTSSGQACNEATHVMVRKFRRRSSIF